MTTTRIPLERQFPSIPWRQPIVITRVDGVSWLFCRFCIARRGPKAGEIESIPYGFRSEDDFAAHLAAEHPYEVH
jgi:hypothetical protein